MSPRTLPSLPSVPSPGERLGFDAARAAALTRLSAPATVARVRASGSLEGLRRRFVLDGPEEAQEVARGLARTHRRAALHPLLPPVAGPAGAAATVTAAVAAYREAIAHAGGLRDAQVYLSPESLGAGTAADLAADALAELGDAASAAGVGLTLRTGEPEHADAVLDLAAATRGRLPGLRVSVLARRHRSETDCARLVELGVPVRLVRGGPREQRSVSWADRHEADLAFVRCLGTLLAGGADLVVASHDPVLLDLVDGLAEQAGRAGREVEHQLYHGVQPDLQLRLADAGHRVRVLLPYGAEWTGYLRDLVERPATARRLAEVLLGRG